MERRCFPGTSPIDCRNSWLKASTGSRAIRKDRVSVSRTTVVGFRPTLIRRPIVFCPSTPVIQMKLRSADGITGEDPSGPCVHCGWNLRRRTSVSLRSYNKPRIKYSVPDPPAHTGMRRSHHPHIQEGSSLTGQRDPANKWYSVTID